MPSWHVKTLRFVLAVNTNLRLVWHLDANLQGILEHYSGQLTLYLCVMGLYLLPSECISGHFTWDWLGVCVLSMLNFQFFIGPVLILQVHARKFCGQVTCLLMFIMLKSLFPFGAEVKDVWSYNFIFTVLISKYFPECSIDNATSYCMMHVDMLEKLKNKFQRT